MCARHSLCRSSGESVSSQVYMPLSMQSIRDCASLYRPASQICQSVCVPGAELERQRPFTFYRQESSRSASQDFLGAEDIAEQIYGQSSPNETCAASMCGR